MCLAIPQFQALHDAVTFQRNGAASCSIADYVADLQRFCLTVAIVNNNAVKLDRRVVYADLQKAVAAGSFSNFDIVMVMLTVNVRLAKINPVFRVGRWQEQRLKPEPSSCVTPLLLN
jgi:hypothetical protein